MFREAADRLAPKDYQPYLKMRRMLREPAGYDQKAFRKLFTQYYRLNSGGMSVKWKNRYFHWLFQGPPAGADPYTRILRDLYAYPRPAGDQVLAFSFVSKLVAIHDESRPIMDLHVSNFFGLSAPRSGGVEHRISGFIANLNRIQATYEEWSRDPRFRRLLGTMGKNEDHAELLECHPNRLCDFLVWTVGRLRIGDVAEDSIEE